MAGAEAHSLCTKHSACEPRLAAPPNRLACRHWSGCREMGNGRPGLKEMTAQLALIASSVVGLKRRLLGCPFRVQLGSMYAE